jgi:CBS domain-containing protein
VPGLAVPHARFDDIGKLWVAVGTSKQGIDFGRGLENPAYVIILILTPAEAPATYLQALAAVGKMFSAKGAIDVLRKMSTAEDVWDFFEGGRTTLPQVVTAGDMMVTEYVSLQNTAFLSEAIDLFCRHRSIDIPVLDEDGDLVGIMTEQEVLKLALPEYILWLDDLKPILHLEPFVEILNNEHTLRVGEVMSDRYVTVTEDVPAIEVARILMTSEASEVLVVRDKRLVGVIALGDFLARVLRK